MKTQKITIDDGFGNELEHIIIDHENGEFTSMLKSTYDEMIAAQNVPAEKS